MQFFDPSVSTTSQSGHLEPLPLTLGPNWQPNDIRIMFASASGVSGSSTIQMPMRPDPPTGFTAGYQLNPGVETHGVYYRRLVSGDSDTASTYWPKPQGWRHFMYGVITARGVDPSVSPTAGTLPPSSITYTVADATNSVSVGSVAVPRAGTMVFFLGNIGAPWQTKWPNWAVSVGVPDGWTHVAATDKSGNTYYQYGTDPSIVMVAKNFTAAGSTGTVVFPAAQGAPAFAGLYMFLPAPSAPSVTISAA